MSAQISFVFDNKLTTIDFQNSSRYTPTTTVLNYLRSLPDHKGTKEGCAEGDCGACTVVLGELIKNDKIKYTAVDSCLVFLPMINRKQLITVENLKSSAGNLHPVQQAMVKKNGSQCGFCTPGIVMSLFSLYKNINTPSRQEIEEALGGNLCRCTGYEPIIDAAREACSHGSTDHFTKTESITIKMLSSLKGDFFSINSQGENYYQPLSLKEALRLKKKHPKAIIINGASDVALRVTKNHEKLKEIIDLSAIKKLKGISKHKTYTCVRAGTNLSDLNRHAKQVYPALHNMLAVFGSLQIRNLATLGGNLGTASPIGDSAPTLSAYNARLLLTNLKGTRKVKIDDFITGYRQTVCKSDELITAIEIPHVEPGIQIRFYKFSKRRDLDIATTSGGFRLQLDKKSKIKNIKLAFGGLAQETKRAKKTEKYLTGKKWNRENVNNALELLEQEFSPISDARSSAKGRIISARNLLLKFWTETNNKEA
jgi:xanthine dehydrogenase small subunit